MRYTVSIKLNRDFKRLYSSGKTTANSFLAVYYRRNKAAYNRLGITVSTKVGKAVIRNRVRRRIKESYRLMEESLSIGYDIVIVARIRAADASYGDINDALKTLFIKTGVYQDKL